jgi:hypothetical protein
MAKHGASFDQLELADIALGLAERKAADYPLAHREGSMRHAVVAAAVALLVGCTFPGAQVRKRAASDFGCAEDEIVVHELPSGYLARGCRKEAEYLVQDGRVTRNSEITKATVDERPPLPIDRIPNTNSIGLD